MKSMVTIIGGGLAGCEAAYAALKGGAQVTLYEMKPRRFSPAHKMETLAELVCSNSLKSENIENASGLLKEEMRLLGSLVVDTAAKSRVPAGAALAVDRSKFSELITKQLVDAGVRIIREEAVVIAEDRPLVIATGPLTSDAFAVELKKAINTADMYFYDAIAPVVYKDSIDFSKAFMGSRYNKGGDDYINCPMTMEEYVAFVSELKSAGRAPVREFEEKKYFDKCMPVEAMAERGIKTLAFGPLRPMGLDDPATGKRPYAVVQLRMENLEGTLYNIVGFQTRLTHAEQKRVFALIPALKNAEYARYGSMHRNTYVNSPGCLLPTLELKTGAGVFLAGQITGVEGYCESAASGIVAGINAVRQLKGEAPLIFPPSTMTGALLRHITSETDKEFQPMNANFGILEGYRGNKGKSANKALEEMKRFLFS